jgi:hypothetical protein
MKAAKACVEFDRFDLERTLECGTGYGFSASCGSRGVVLLVMALLVLGFFVLTTKGRTVGGHCFFSGTPPKEQVTSSPSVETTLQIPTLSNAYALMRRSTSRGRNISMATRQRVLRTILVCLKSDIQGACSRGHHARPALSKT